MSQILAKQKESEEAWKEERYAKDPKILVNMKLISKMKKTDIECQDLTQWNFESIGFLDHIRKDNIKMHKQTEQIVEEYERQRHFAKMMETARKSEN